MIEIAKIIAISVIIIGVFVVAFLGVFFPKKSESAKKAERAYIKVDDARIESDKNLKQLFARYNENKITEEELLSEVKTQIPLILSLTKESEAMKKEYKSVSNADKVFGFRSIKIFFGHLGMPIVATALGVYLLLLFFKEEDLFFRKVTFSFSIVGLITGLFYVIWVFYPSPDIPDWAYILLLLLFSMLGTVVAFFIGRYMYGLSQIDLVIKTQNLLSFITFDIKRKYISKQDRQEYISDYLGEIEKLSKK
ncbi:hypothetical protein [Aquimarina latercula]|uniref:hypothetical protein n=1 Tax=Aquimarina latercula TaxID=987 RepID=UPI000426C3B6|nr:hypothetical protein [Aquimarina latercula]